MAPSIRWRNEAFSYQLSTKALQETKPSQLIDIKFCGTVVLLPFVRLIVALEGCDLFSQLQHSLSVERIHSATRHSDSSLLSVADAAWLSALLTSATMLVFRCLVRNLARLGKTTGHVIPVDGGLSEAYLR